MNTESIYMQWAKKRPKVKYDLALSGILNLPFSELEPSIEDIDLNGDNSYGYRPLVAALAAHCQVAPESVVTISGGTSMANHLAMAAAVEHGDEVLIEQPTYEPLLAVAEYFGAKIKRFPRSFENEFRICVEEIARHLRRLGSASGGKTKRGRTFKIAEVRSPRQTDSGKQSRRAERVSRIARGSQSGAN